MTDQDTTSRRQFGLAALATTLSPVLAAAATDKPGAAGPGAGAVGALPAGPPLSWVFDLDVRVAPAQELGEAGGGRRRVIPITGGSLKGPGRSGTVLPGGADWQTLRADGVTLLQARYTLQMDDGQVVGVINTGIRKAAPDIVKRLLAGEVVDPSLYYFRTTPVFEVGPGPHLWLTESVFICVGERLPELVRMRVFQAG